jgi:hypothetical protein
VNIKDNRVLDVTGGKDAEGTAVQAWKRNGSAAQRWKVAYLDEQKKAQTKGLHKDTGFEINRPFYFVSRLPMKRVMECIGANNVVLKRWRKNVTQ